MRVTCLRLLPLTLWALFTACSTQLAYQAGQQWQKQECGKLPDLSDRARCEKSNAMSYERYRAEAEAAKKPPP